MAIAGTVEAKLLVQIGDGEPVKLGDLDIPIEVSPVILRRGIGDIGVAHLHVTRGLVSALRDAADALDPDGPAEPSMRDRIRLDIRRTMTGLDEKGTDDVNA